MTTTETYEQEIEEVVDEPEGAAMEETGESVSLRPYQNDCVQAVLREFKHEKVQSTLCVLCTGAGKTIAMSDLTRRAGGWGHGVLWLCHRDELIRQGARALSRFGIHALVEKAGENALGGFGLLSKTVVASVQTLRGARLQQWPQDAFRLIISDEAHHSISDGWLQILEHFGTARHVGFTATADRLDGANIGRVFESLAYEYNLRRAIGEGYLVPLKVDNLPLDPPIDLRDLRITAGDFNSGDLEEVIQQNIGRLVSAIVQENALEDRPTIAFTPDISSAVALASALNDVGISADHISCKTTNRADKLERFRQGKFQVMTNAMILTEGTDLPFVSCILMARPTKSRSLMAQCIGRGTRLYDGKTDCKIIDLPCLTQKHSLVSPVELFDDGGLDDRVIQRAKEIVDNGEKKDLLEAVEQAKEDVELEDRVRIKRQSVTVRARFQYDPLSVMGTLGVPHKASRDSWFNTKPPSPKMVNCLARFKVQGAEQMSYQEAKKLIGKLCERADKKLATVPQVNYLIALNVAPEQARSMSFAEAGETISRLKGA